MFPDMDLIWSSLNRFRQYINVDTLIQFSLLSYFCDATSACFLNSACQSDPYLQLALLLHYAHPDHYDHIHHHALLLHYDQIHCLIAPRGAGQLGYPVYQSISQLGTPSLPTSLTILPFYHSVSQFGHLVKYGPLKRASVFDL